MRSLLLLVCLACAAFAAPAAAQVAFFDDHTDTIEVEGQTVVETASTYEAVVLFPDATAPVLGAWPVAAEPDGPGGPGASALHAPYPNPSSGRAAVRYDVAAAGRVRLAVYDVLGREVAVLVDAERAPGRYEAALDGGGLNAGTYLIRMTTASGFARARPVMLLR